jgi:hypothetical protein
MQAGPAGSMTTSTGKDESRDMASEISELMHSSLFRVFAERDPERRKAAMAENLQ